MLVSLSQVLASWLKFRLLSRTIVSLFDFTVYLAGEGEASRFTAVLLYLGLPFSQVSSPTCKQGIRTEENAQNSTWHTRRTLW